MKRKQDAMENSPANRRKVLPRRDFFIQTSTVVAGVLLASCSNAFVAQEKPQSTAPTHVQPVNSTSVNYQLPPLGYAYNALEPYIDEETMRLHHDKHHAAYVQNLNAALKGSPFASTPPEVLLGRLNELPQNIRTPVRNNGGGHVNHSMFWEIMTPGGSTAPTGDLAKAIDSTFGSFAAFKTAFEDTGKNVFGSGWVWLSLNSAGKLALVSAPNQDNPLMNDSYPIMGNDVWEHAYYLKYQNRRPEYLNAWWNVLNWDNVNRRFEQAKKFIRTP